MQVPLNKREQIMNQLDKSTFITVWDMGAGDKLRFPSKGRYTIDWGDGSPIEAVTSPTPTHVYTGAGEYTVTASNTITQVCLCNVTADKLIDIQQWGTARWESMEAAFFGAINMTMSAPDAPNLLGVTNMGFMFALCRAFNSPINCWNVSCVTGMQYMFYGATSFKQSLIGWDVNRVRTMRFMFYGVEACNEVTLEPDITDWPIDLPNTDISHMFSDWSLCDYLERLAVQQEKEAVSAILNTGTAGIDGSSRPS